MATPSRGYSRFYWWVVVLGLVQVLTVNSWLVVREKQEEHDPLRRAQARLHQVLELGYPGQSRVEVSQDGAGYRVLMAAPLCDPQQELRLREAASALLMLKDGDEVYVANRPRSWPGLGPRELLGWGYLAVLLGSLGLAWHSRWARAQLALGLLPYPDLRELLLKPMSLLQRVWLAGPARGSDAEGRDLMRLWQQAFFKDAGLVKEGPRRVELTPAQYGAHLCALYGLPCRPLLLPMLVVVTLFAQLCIHTMVLGNPGTPAEKAARSEVTQQARPLDPLRVVTYERPGMGVGSVVVTRAQTSRWSVVGVNRLWIVTVKPPRPRWLLLLILALGLGLLGPWRHASVAPAEPETPASALIEPQVHPLGVDLGSGLVGLIDPTLCLVRCIRTWIDVSLGIEVPPVRFVSYPALPDMEYRILLRGHEVARGELRPGHLLAAGSEETLQGLGGTLVNWIYGLGVWLDPAHQAQAEQLGLYIFKPEWVLKAHLEEVISRHAADLVGVQETRALLDRLARTHPALVDAVIPQITTLVELTQVLRSLLQEGVSVRDLEWILEGLAEAGQSHQVGALVEAARWRLRRSLCAPLARQGRLTVITVDPWIEAALLEDTVVEALPVLRETLRAASTSVLLCAPGVRRQLWTLLHGCCPQLAVLSYEEVAPGLEVHSLAVAGASRSAH